jgi:hypothetical protein
MRALQSADFDVAQGVVGDRYTRVAGNRQVTLIQAEHLAAIASHMGRSQILPVDLRRNVVTHGFNLIALKEKRFRIGSAVLETTGECHPCSRMEKILGVGGYNAVRGSAASRPALSSPEQFVLATISSRFPGAHKVNFDASSGDFDKPPALARTTATGRR